MRQVIWNKIMCLCVLLSPPVLLMTSGRFHRPEENYQSEPSRSLVISEQLSITRKPRSNGQTRQRWSNMNQYSVTVMPISHLKCFQKHLIVYCLAVKWESLSPGRHVEISWGNTKHRPPAWAKFDRLVGVREWLTAASVEWTANRNTLTLKWHVIGQSLPWREPRGGAEV